MWNLRAPAFYHLLNGCVALMLHSIRHLGLVRLTPVLQELKLQIFFTGSTATAGMVVRGASIGTLIIAYVITVLNADVSLAVRILLLVVLREVGPMLAAVLVIQRSGTAVTTELALMRLSGELTSLRRMQIDPRDFLVVPRVIGISLSAMVLTFYVQVIAVGGGMFLSSIVIDVTIDEIFESFFRLASVTDLLFAGFKSFLFGVAIAVVSCYHGLNPPGNSINAVPRAAINTVTQCTLLIMLINVTFSYLVYGVLFFGLVRAVH